MDGLIDIGNSIRKEHNIEDVKKMEDLPSTIEKFLGKAEDLANKYNI